MSAYKFASWLKGVCNCNFSSVWHYFWHSQNTSDITEEYNFICLFSWQIRAVISKGTWVRENVLQPSTLPIFLWGSIQGCTQVPLLPGWIFLFNIIAQLSVEGRFMTFHAAEVCIYCNFLWIRLLMFQSAIRVFTSPLQFYWHFSPSFHLCYSQNFTLNHLSLLWRDCNAAPRHTAMIKSTSEHFVYS